MTTIPDVVLEMKKSYENGVNDTLAKRIHHLRAFNTLCLEERAGLLEALRKDLNKGESEGFLTEISLIHNAIHHAISHLEEMMAEEKVSLGEWVIMPDMDARIRKAPHGTVLIIAPWNYPVQLALLPMVGAIAGGNTIVLKPSEIASHVSAELSRTVSKHMDPKLVRVIEGAVPETQLLLAQPFNMVFFTGSTPVGKLVYQAAAKLMVWISNIL